MSNLSALFDYLLPLARKHQEYLEIRIPSRYQDYVASSERAGSPVFGGNPQDRRDARAKISNLLKAYLADDPALPAGLVEELGEMARWLGLDAPGGDFMPRLHELGITPESKFLVNVLGEGLGFLDVVERDQTALDHGIPAEQWDRRVSVCREARGRVFGVSRASQKLLLDPNLSTGEVLAKLMDEPTQWLDTNRLCGDAPESPERLFEELRPLVTDRRW